jgi:hypothetical protein
MKMLVREACRKNGVFRRRIAFWTGLAAAFLLGATSSHAQVSDCTEDALRDALLGIGDVTFDEDCTIVVTSPLDISPDITSLDADGHKVVISGGGSNLVFNIQDRDDAFTLNGITVTSGSNSTGGAMFISENGIVILTNCTFAGNIAAGISGTNGVDGRNGGNGGSSGSKGGPGTDGQGGAVYNLGDLTVLNCLFTNNQAQGGSGGNGGNGGNGAITGGNGGAGAAGGSARGGAIYNLGFLDAEQSTFAGNNVSGGFGGFGGTNGSGATPGRPGNGGAGGNASGAGIYNDELALDLTISACTFSDNIASGGNSADGGSAGNAGNAGPAGGLGSGGAVANISELEATNCTFFRNAARGGIGGNGGPGNISGGAGGAGGIGVGGGLYNATGTVFVVNCTFASGMAVGGTNGLGGSGPRAGKKGKKGRTQGGNVANTNGVFTLINTIVNTNGLRTDTNGFGHFDDGGHNISSDKSIKFTDPTSLIKTDPKLKPLANNGGPTLTMAIATNSPARDAGDDSAAPDTDQRGAPRKLSNPSDIGAYELASPFILTQPQDQVQTNGGTVTFSVQAGGEPTLRYYWRFFGTNVHASFSPNFTIVNIGPTNVGPYSVLVSNVFGTVLSSNAFLIIGAAPVITTQPSNQTVTAGSPVTFSVVASGDAPLIYQWSLNTTNLPNATNSFYSIASAQTNNAGGYSVLVTNQFGSNRSATATLTIAFPPTIVTQPSNQTVTAGSPVSFSVTASGSAPLTYQWRFNGTNISGATAPSFGKSSAQPSDDGNYDVIVANSFGTVDSATATLTVTAPGGVGIQSLQTVGSFVVGPPSFTLQYSGGELDLIFLSGPSGVYVTELNTNLGTSSWVPVLTNFATGGWITNRVPNPTLPSAFFRLRVD